MLARGRKPGVPRKSQVVSKKKPILSECSFQHTQLYHNRRKRDKLVEKIKAKCKDEITRVETGSEDQTINTKKIQENSSLEFTKTSKAKNDNKGQKISPKNSDLLHENFLLKQNYISLMPNNVINGSFGHTTVIFKHPIIEGSYYMELKILEDSKSQYRIINKSAVRLGICREDYILSLPLGQGNSIGWKSADGKVIEQKQSKMTSQPSKAGDIIGIGVIIMPPHKHLKKSKQYPGGRIILWKNGKNVGQIDIKEQEFYHFSISLYNYARVQVHLNEKTIRHLPSGFYTYEQLLSSTIHYQNLKFLGKI